MIKQKIIYRGLTKKENQYLAAYNKKIHKIDA